MMRERSPGDGGREKRAERRLSRDDALRLARTWKRRLSFASLIGLAVFLWLAAGHVVGVTSRPSPHLQPQGGSQTGGVAPPASPTGGNFFSNEPGYGFGGGSGSPLTSTGAS
jgi:hypothetical protein